MDCKWQNLRMYSSPMTLVSLSGTCVGMAGGAFLILDVYCSFVVHTVNGGFYTCKLLNSQSVYIYTDCQSKNLAMYCSPMAPVSLL